VRCNYCSYERKQKFLFNQNNQHFTADNDAAAAAADDDDVAVVYTCIHNAF
jgi:hypothetical protein